MNRLGKTVKPTSCEGMLAVRDANQRLKLDLPYEGSYTTIAGFLMDSAGRVPKVGDKVEHSKGI